MNSTPVRQFAATMLGHEPTVGPLRARSAPGGWRIFDATGAMISSPLFPTREAAQANADTLLTEWYMEPGDPSVGIFGASFWHERCDKGECVEDRISPHDPEVDGKITCPACGAERTFPYPDEDEAEEA